VLHGPTCKIAVHAKWTQQGTPINCCYPQPSLSLLGTSMQEVLAISSVCSSVMAQHAAPQGQVGCFRQGWPKRQLYVAYLVCRLKAAMASLALAALLSPWVNAPSCCSLCATADANLHSSRCSHAGETHRLQSKSWLEDAVVLHPWHQYCSKAGSALRYSHTCALHRCLC